MKFDSADLGVYPAHGKGESEECIRNVLTKCKVYVLVLGSDLDGCLV